MEVYMETAYLNDIDNSNEHKFSFSLVLWKALTFCWVQIFDFFLFFFFKVA